MALGSSPIPCTSCRRIRRCRSSTARCRSRTSCSARACDMPIDHFLCTLAADQGRRAAGIVLSGAGKDGTQGLAEIKALGGVTAVQDPDTAEFRGDAAERHRRRSCGRRACRRRELAAFLMRRADDLAALTAEQAGGRRPGGDPGRRAQCHRPRLPLLQARHAGAAHPRGGWTCTGSTATTTTPACCARRQGRGGRPAQGPADRRDRVLPPARGLAGAGGEGHRRRWSRAPQPQIDAARVGAGLRHAARKPTAWRCCWSRRIERSGKKLGLQIFATDADASAVEIARAGQLRRGRPQGHLAGAAAPVLRPARTAATRWSRSCGS